MASRDVRVRVRPSVVRVRISEPALRTVVRVAAENPQLKYPYAYLPRDWQALFFLISQRHICFGLNRLGHRAPRRFIRDAAENVTSFAVSFLLLYYFYFFTSLYCRELCFGYFLDSSIKSKASRECLVRGRPSVARVRRSEPAARTVVQGAAENPQLPTRIVPEVIVVVKTTAACLRYHVEALVLLVSDNIHYRLIGIARISCQLYMVNICE